MRQLKSTRVQTGSPTIPLRELVLASRNRCAENIGVEAIIVAELELCNIQRHVFAADFVEAADDAALEDRPKSFNRYSCEPRRQRTDVRRGERLCAGLLRQFERERAAYVIADAAEGCVGRASRAWPQCLLPICYPTR